MLFFSGFLNIVWEYIEIDFRWKFAWRDFLKKRPQQIIFCWRFSKPFFWWTVRLHLAKDAKVSINRLNDYAKNHISLDIETNFERQFDVIHEF